MSTGNGTLLESEKYHVIRELGRGGMGVVYLAEDRQLRRQVALKVLYDYLNRDQAFVDRFQEEACSVSTLHHPNIICVHGLERAGDIVAIDMEFVEGASLDQLAVVTPHIAVSIARDVLGGLAACHQIGVIHRDIKPSNILINEMGQSKITDFGLATAYASHMEAALGGSTSSGFYMGTPRYMPIQAWEGAPPEPYWDLYSFGVVLYELLSGSTAFPGSNPIEVMRRQFGEPLPPLRDANSDISPELSALVEALLNSSRKLTGLTCAGSIDLLREAPEFKALRESDAVPTLASLPRPRISRARKRRFSYRLATGLAAVLVTICYGIFLILNGAGGQNPVSPVVGPATIPRNGAAFYKFDTAGDRGGGDMMLETSSHSEPVRLKGYSGRTLWMMDLAATPIEGQYTVSGNWASRMSADSAATEYGTLTGTLLWDPTRDQPVATISLQRSLDRSEAPMTVVCTRKPVEFDRRQFFRSLESNELLISLLYAELLSHNFAWAVSLEAELPSLTGARARIPNVGEAMVVDGLFNETTWVEGAYDFGGLIGEVSPRDAATGAKLMVRWDGEMVYFAITCPGDAEAFEIGIAPGVERFPINAGRFIFRIDRSGAVEAQYFEGGRQRPWTCNWQSSIVTDGDTTCVEIGVPAAYLAESAKPAEGRRWRVNGRFDRAIGDAIIWGDEALRELEHGALLVFQSAAQ